MKKTITAISILLLSATAIFAQTFSWTQKASFSPGNRAGAFAFSIGTKGYVGSGITQTGPVAISYVNDFWEYDPALDAWTQMASLPGISHTSSAAFSIGGKGYITTGFDGSTYLTETLEYDPALNYWVTKANFPGVARYTTSCFVIGNYAYVGLGKGGPYYTDFYKYDSALDSWTAIASIGGTSRQNAKAFAVGNYGYVIGGANDNSGDYFDNWQYDPSLDTWTQKANYPGSGSFAGMAFSINGLGYAGCGSNLFNSSTHDDFFSYDPASDVWAAVASFGGGTRNALSCFVIGNKGYAGLGSIAMFPVISYQNDWWEFSSPLGINSNDAENTIHVFVNSNLLTVELQKASTENYTLNVFDVSGKIICSEIIYAGTNLHKTNLSKVAKGNYLYEIISGNEKIKTGKFFIE